MYAVDNLARATDNVEDLSLKLDVLKTLSELDCKDYLVSSILNLYNLLITNSQYMDKYNHDGIIVNRVIRCKRYIPNYILDYHKATRVIVGGLYLVVPVYIFPTSKIKANMKRHRKCIVRTEEDGLLSTSEVDYSTTRMVSDYSVAIVKGSWVNEWINKSSQYEYVNFDI